MATTASLLQPKTLPIKADPMGPPAPTDVDRAQAKVSDIERQLGIARGEQAEFEAQKGMMKAGQDVKRAESAAAATRAEREAIETAPAFTQTQDVEREMMNAYFQPTQRSAQENAALFSLINVLGFFIGAGGKRSATQAMSAMNGMLEGKQAGDTQRFREEKIKFDTNLRALNQKYTMLNSQLKKVADLAARDKMAAAQELDMVLARENADFLKTHISKVGLAKTIAELESAQKGAQRALSIAEQNEFRAEEKRKEAERALERERERLRFQRETSVMLKGIAPPSKPEIFQDQKGQLYSVNPATQEVTPIQLPEGVRLTKAGAKAKEREPKPPTDVEKGIKSNAVFLDQIEGIIERAEDLAKRGEIRAIGVIKGEVPYSAAQLYMSDAEKNLLQDFSALTNQKLKDQSGATVTGAEFARQRGVLPLRNDEIDTVINKLKNWKRAVSDETGVYGRAYPAEVNKYNIVLELPKEKTRLVKGLMYRTPQGNLIWNGTEFIGQEEE